MNCAVGMTAAMDNITFKNVVFNLVLQLHLCWLRQISDFLRLHEMAMIQYINTFDRIYSHNMKNGHDW